MHVNTFNYKWINQIEYVNVWLLLDAMRQWMDIFVKVKMKI